MADSRIVTDPDTTSPDSLPNKPAVSRGARACTVCRTAKMKCVGAENDGAKPCQRCRRSNLECVFEKHRRGRKPGSKLSEASKMLRKLEKNMTSAKVKRQDIGELSPQHPYPVSDSRSAPPPPDQSYHSPYSPREVYVATQVPARAPNSSPPYPPSATHSQFPTLTAPYPPPPCYGPDPASAPSQRATSTSSLPRSMEEDEEDDKDPDDNIYPAKMVERENRRHSFFGVVLDASGHSKISSQKTQSPSYPPLPHRPPEAIAIPRLPSAATAEDPITTGILSETDVATLFNKVFICLNPFINLFDPSLHTLDYVRSRCPFLFTTLLMAGCKFWQPECYKACRRLAEKLCIRAFQEDWKRIEVVQAFACMTYWKEPDDTRTWRFIGYACRMAVELGLNRHCVTPPVGETQLQRLERRNRERTYLVLWVHDRSLSMQTGRQWMLPEDDLVRNSATWHEGSTLHAVDVVVSAQVELRRIAAEVTDVFYIHKSSVGMLHANADVNYEILLRACNGKLNVWSSTWTGVLNQAGGDSFQVSFLMFFRLHVRLFLNSFGLQSSRDPEHSPSVSALSTCYTAATETLRLVTKDFATVDVLRYSQDSITLMTAYAAIFLLKLLRTEVEIGEAVAPKIHAHILDAAEAYLVATEDMPPSSSVEYHGSFLRALVMKDRARIERKTGRREFEDSSTSSSAAAAAAAQAAGSGERREINGQQDQSAMALQPQAAAVAVVAAQHAFGFPAHPLVSLVTTDQASGGYDPAAGATVSGPFDPGSELGHWYSLEYGTEAILPGGYVDPSSNQPAATSAAAAPAQHQPQQQNSYAVYGPGISAA